MDASSWGPRTLSVHPTPPPTLGDNRKGAGPLVGRRRKGKSSGPGEVMREVKDGKPYFLPVLDWCISMQAKARLPMPRAAKFLDFELELELKLQLELASRFGLWRGVAGRRGMSEIQ